MKTRVTLHDGMHFRGELDGFEILLDADPQFGGQSKGPRPKGLTLTSLAGCTAMDVIAILRKMGIEPESFSVDAEGDLTGEHPKVFERIKLTYHFRGKELPRNKLERAVHLSQDRYCGVSAMLRAAVPIDSEILIDE
jgi:putative redox protein